MKWATPFDEMQCCRLGWSGYSTAPGTSSAFQRGRSRRQRQIARIRDTLWRRVAFRLEWLVMVLDEVAQLEITYTFMKIEDQRPR